MKKLIIFLTLGAMLQAACTPAVTTTSQPSSASTNAAQATATVKPKGKNQQAKPDVTAKPKGKQPAVKAAQRLMGA